MADPTGKIMKSEESNYHEPIEILEVRRFLSFYLDIEHNEGENISGLLKYLSNDYESDSFLTNFAPGPELKSNIDMLVNRLEQTKYITDATYVQLMSNAIRENIALPKVTTPEFFQIIVDEVLGYIGLESSESEFVDDSLTDAIIVDLNSFRWRPGSHTSNQDQLCPQFRLFDLSGNADIGLVLEFSKTENTALITPDDQTEASGIVFELEMHSNRLKKHTLSGQTTVFSLGSSHAAEVAETCGLPEDYRYWNEDDAPNCNALGRKLTDYIEQATNQITRRHLRLISDLKDWQTVNYQFNLAATTAGGAFRATQKQPVLPELLLGLELIEPNYTEWRLLWRQKPQIEPELVVSTSGKSLHDSYHHKFLDGEILNIYGDFSQGIAAASWDWNVDANVITLNIE